MTTCKVPLTLPLLSGADLAEHAWDDDEIDCYGIVGPPGGGRLGPYLAYLFDMRLRRWYSISANHHEPDPSNPEWDPLEDPYWCNVLRQTGHRGRDDFNHIDVDANGSLSLSFCQRTADGYNGLAVHPPPKSSGPDYPYVPFTDLQNRQYFDYCVETCIWNGERCVFKQSLMRPHVSMLDSEIVMLKRLAHSPYIVHLIAYVVDEDGDLRGILLPWAGVTIDTLPTVRLDYLRDVVYGLRDIHTLPMLETEVAEKKEPSHGDVFCRNILVMDGVTRLIDLDNPGLDYPGDQQAFLNVLLTLQDKVEGDLDNNRIGAMEAGLRAGMTFTELSETMKDW